MTNLEPIEPPPDWLVVSAVGVICLVLLFLAAMAYGVCK